MESSEINYIAQDHPPGGHEPVVPPTEPPTEPTPEPADDQEQDETK